MYMCMCAYIYIYIYRYRYIERERAIIAILDIIFIIAGPSAPRPSSPWASLALPAFPPLRSGASPSRSLAPDAEDTCVCIYIYIYIYNPLSALERLPRRLSRSGRGGGRRALEARAERGV